MTRLTGQQVADAGLTGWANLLGGLHTRIASGNFATGLAVVNSIGAAAEDMNHHPDIALQYGHVDVRLSSHDEHGITERDVRLARAINEIVADAGLALSAAGLSRMELGLDTPAQEAILAFWHAVLGVEVPADGANGEVRDPADAFPPIWFQRSGSEEPRQHWHWDVWVDPGDVAARIDAALAAGGTLVSDDEAPSFWVLADAEGNKICLCTWQGRG
jgi:4a-hydroxytetrahydrobiopterin dehydratase